VTGRVLFERPCAHWARPGALNAGPCLLAIVEAERETISWLLASAKKRLRLGVSREEGPRLRPTPPAARSLREG